MNKTFYPCCWFAFYFCAGIIAGHFYSLPLLVLGAVFFSAGLLSLLLSRRRYLSEICLSLAIFMFGMIWVQAHGTIADDDVSRLSYETRREPLVIEGIVDSQVEQRDFFKSKKTMFTFNIDHVIVNGRSQSRKGRVIVQIFRPENLRYGDRVRIEGKLHQPFVQEDDGPVSYKDYLKIRGIRYIFSVKKTGVVEVIQPQQGRWLNEWSFRLCGWIKDIYGRYFTVNEAGLMNAMILGDRTRVPDHVNELFLRTGTVHVLAISGFNVGIVAGLFLMVLRFFPLSRSLILGIVMVLLAAYCFMSGASPSVLRSTIMIDILLVGFIWEKEPQPMNTLAGAGVAILMYNPLYLFDIGFQLSFICVAAIFLVSPFLKREVSLFEDMPEWEFNFLRWVTHSLLLSLAIWIAVAGLIAYYFQIITPVTILANLFVVPVVGAVIALGFLLILVEILFPVASLWVALSVKALLNALIALVFLFDQLPYASIFIKPISQWQLSIYYAVVALAALIFVRIAPFHRQSLNNGGRIDGNPASKD